MSSMIGKICAAFVAAVVAGVSVSCSALDDTGMQQAQVLPVASPQQPEQYEEQPAEQAEESDTDEEWKNNLGSIALGEQITYEGSGIAVEGNVVHITAGGDYEISGTLADGMIHVNTKEKVKLRLSGVDITNSSGPAIFFEDAKKAFITISENTVNNLTDGAGYSVDAKATLFSNDTLEIKGSGTLNITGNAQHAIAGDDDVIIENGVINISNAAKDGIHANDNVTITGGTLNIKAASDGIESEADVVIDGGSLAVEAGDDGIHAETALTINAGDIKITGSNEGLEGKTAITVNDGNIRIKASDDTLNAGEDMVINGGYIYAEGNGDGIDSNGNLTINGGTVIAFGGNSGEGAIDVGDRNSTFTVNGGTVIAGGGNMSVNVSTDSRQHSVWLGGQLNEGTLVNIAGGNASETFTILKQSSLVFYSSANLQANTDYTVTTGGSSSGTATDGLYSGGEYSGGSALGSFNTSAINSSIGSVGGGMGGGMGGERQNGTRPEGGGPQGGERPQMPGGRLPQQPNSEGTENNGTDIDSIPGGEVVTM